MPLTSWARSGTGQPRALVLLGQHLIQPGLQLTTGRRHGVLPVEERDGLLKVTAEVPQLERGQRMQGMLRLVNSGRLP